MKKAKVILLATIISVVLLGGCDKKDNTEADNNVSGDEEKVADGEGTGSDFLNDNDSYYIIIDGKKFAAGDKLSSLSEVGYNIDEEEKDEEIPANRYMIGAGKMNNSNGDYVLHLTPYNIGSSAIKLSDAVIGGFSVGVDHLEKDARVAEIEVYGGIKLNSTEEEIKQVYGEPSYVYEGNDYTELEFASDDAFREFTFRLSKDGKVILLNWQNLVFNE